MISRQVPGQMNLFDILEDFFASRAKVKKSPTPRKRWKRKAKAVVASVTAKEEAREMKPEDYLKKGEYLLSLAKDRFKKELEQLTLSDYEKKLYSIEIEKYESLQGIVAKMAKVIRTMLKAEVDYDEEGEFMKFLRSQISTPFSLTPLKRDTEIRYSEANGDEVKEEVWGSPAAYELRRKWHRSDDMLNLVIWEDNSHPMSVIGYRAFSHPASRRDLLYRTSMLSVHCTDIAFVLAWLIVISQYNKLIKDESRRTEVKTVFAGARDYVKRFFLPLFPASSVFEATYGEKGVDMSGRVNFYDFYSLIASETCGAPIKIPDRWNHRPSSEFLAHVAEKCGVNIGDVKVLGETPVQKRNQTLEDAWQTLNFKSASLTTSGKPFCYILSRKTELAFMASNPTEAADLGLAVKLSDFQMESDKYIVANPMERQKHWILPSYSGLENSAMLEVMEVLIHTLFTERKAAIDAANYYTSLGSKDHAKSYQTKKGIPANILKEMQESTFNNYFGYVELDELCDKEKVRTIADEFTAMKEMLFKSLDLKEVSLRFRRLGNHKASGLYYPQVNCLCVDVGGPGSFTHELGHAIDHITGNGRARSEEGDFYSIWARYCDLLDKYLFSGDAEKVKRLKGNTKYNISYYRIKTEVFARSFEMYCTRVLGIENSICNPDNEDDFAYPVDETLDGLVKEYFDNLGKVLNYDESVSDESENEESLEAA